MTTKRLLQIVDHTGPFRVEVPAESKVTFGPAIPDPKTRERMRQNGESRPDTYAVRVYKGATEKAGLLAVFTCVSAFRDLSATKLLRPVIGDNGQTEWTDDEDAWNAAKLAAERLNNGENTVEDPPVHRDSRAFRRHKHV